MTISGAEGQLLKSNRIIITNRPRTDAGITGLQSTRDHGRGVIYLLAAESKHPNFTVKRWVPYPVGRFSNKINKPQN